MNAVFLKEGSEVLCFTSAGHTQDVGGIMAALL